MVNRPTDKSLTIDQSNGQSMLPLGRALTIDHRAFAAIDHCPPRPGRNLQPLVASEPLATALALRLSLGLCRLRDPRCPQAGPQSLQVRAPGTPCIQTARESDARREASRVTADRPRTRSEAVRGVIRQLDSRRCLHCGASLADKRADARFCSASHRAMHWARPKPEPRAARWTEAEHNERTGRLYDPLGHWTDISGGDES